MPGGTPGKLSCGGIVLLIVLFLVFRLLTGGSDTSTLAPEEELVQAPMQSEELPAEPTATTKPRPTRTPAAAAGRQYLAGDGLPGRRR